MQFTLQCVQQVAKKSKYSPTQFVCSLRLPLQSIDSQQNSNSCSQSHVGIIFSYCTSLFVTVVHLAGNYQEICASILNK